MIKVCTQRFVGGLVFIVAAILLNWQTLQKLMTETIPIRYVRVEGTFEYIAKQDIKNKIHPLIQLSYFSIDLQRIQQAVITLPWAEKVQVERIWPDRLKLRIYEQQPVVRWQEDGLLNRHGDIFKPINIDAFQSLPVLYGPIEQRYQLLQVMGDLKLGLIKQGLRLTEFRVSDRQSWLLVMESGMIIQLGRFQPLQKFTLLMKTLGVIGNELVAKIEYIDMRYPNGYAVRWRENEQIIWK
ncbi:MAG: FtsQ-type POTRA domain-containing protein [Methyloprofundus sp.]|nr:FtsQ-type POTRA domain-containing protein [Methyloprofundus sp.]